MFILVWTIRKQIYRVLGWELVLKYEAGAEVTAASAPKISFKLIYFSPQLLLQQSILIKLKH